LISVLFAPIILQFKGEPLITGALSATLLAIVAIVVWYSKRERGLAPEKGSTSSNPQKQ
jgi:hypothetical protein